MTSFKNKEVLHISSGREFFGILLAATDPKKSFATGKALNSTVKAGKKSQFEVITIDKSGFMRIKGGDRVKVFGIDQINGKIINPQEIDVFDLQNGRYEVSMKVRQSGKFLLYVLVNGQSVQMSPFSLYVKPGEPNADKSWVSFTPFSNFKADHPPVYKMSAGETLFFNIHFADISGAIIDELDDFDHSRIKIKINGSEAQAKQIRWQLLLSEFGDHSIKAKIFNAETQNIQVFLDEQLLMFIVDCKIIARLTDTPSHDDIHSESLMLDVLQGYAYPSKCIVEFETFKRLPFGNSDQISESAAICGKEQSFVVTFIDEFGNNTSLINDSLEVVMTSGSTGQTLQDMQISKFGDCRSKVTFQVKQSDEYDICIKLGSNSIHPSHSNFKILVIHGEADFAWTKVLNKEDCFESCDISKSQRFDREIQIQTRDQFGNYCKYINWDSEITCKIT